VHNRQPRQTNVKLEQPNRYKNSVIETDHLKTSHQLNKHSETRAFALLVPTVWNFISRPFACHPTVRSKAVSMRLENALFGLESRCAVQVLFHVFELYINGFLLTYLLTL